MLVAFAELCQFIRLVTFQPLDASLNHVRNDGHVILLCDRQTMDNLCCQMRRCVFAITGEPAPAAIAELHFGESLHAFRHDAIHFDIIEDRIEVLRTALQNLHVFVDVFLNPFGERAATLAEPGRQFTDIASLHLRFFAPVSRILAAIRLSRIEVRSLLLHVRQIHSHLLQRALSQHGWKKTVERLFGAAIRILQQVRQRIHHRSSKAWAVTHFQT